MVISRAQHVVDLCVGANVNPVKCFAHLFVLHPQHSSYAPQATGRVCLAQLHCHQRVCQLARRCWCHVHSGKQLSMMARSCLSGRLPAGWASVAAASARRGGQDLSDQSCCSRAPTCLLPLLAAVALVGMLEARAVEPGLALAPATVVMAAQAAVLIHAAAPGVVLRQAVAPRHLCHPGPCRCCSMSCCSGQCCASVATQRRRRWHRLQSFAPAHFATVL